MVRKLGVRMSYMEAPLELAAAAAAAAVQVSFYVVVQFSAVLLRLSPRSLARPVFHRPLHRLHNREPLIIQVIIIITLLLMFNR